MRRKVIKESELQAKINEVNTRLNESFRLDCGYGAYRMINKDGINPFGSSYLSKRELYDKLNSYLFRIG